MTFREFHHGSREYAQECVLRDTVLRQPLGLRLSEADVADDPRHLHFGLFDDDGNLTACVVAVPLSAERVKLRQMAVAEQWQGKGLGRSLLEQLESTLRARGYSRFELHARRSAGPFYQRLGYTATGDEFLEVTIPHVKMVK